MTLLSWKEGRQNLIFQLFSVCSHVYVCIHMCLPKFMCTTCVCLPMEVNHICVHAYRIQRTSDSLKPEYQGLVSHLVWVLETEPRSFAGAVRALSTQLSHLSKLFLNDRVIYHFISKPFPMNRPK